MTEVERKASIALLDKLRGLLVAEYRKVDGDENQAAAQALGNDMHMLNALEDYIKSEPMTALEYLTAKHSMKHICEQMETCESCPMENWYYNDEPVCVATMEIECNKPADMEEAIQLAKRWAQEHPDMINLIAFK